MMKRLAVLLTFLLWLSSSIAPARAQFTDTATWGGTAGGSANAIQLAIPNYSRHIAGVKITFVASANNTTAATIQPSAAVGAVPLRKSTATGQAVLSGGEIAAGQVYTVVYDGANYQLLGSATLNGGRGPVIQVSSALVLDSTTTALCNRTFSLGGSGFYTVTIASPAQFPSSCEFKFINSSGRGRGMIVAGRTTATLWPTLTQTYTNEVQIAWRADPDVLMYRGDITFHVNAVNGSDDPAVSDGLATGFGAYATFQHAIDTGHVYFWLDSGLNIVADCESNYNQIFHVFGLFANSHIVGISGLLSRPFCEISPTVVTGAIVDVQDYGVVVMGGFTIGFAVNPGGTLVSARQHTILDLDNMSWASNTGGINISGTGLSSINVTNAQNFEGNAAAFATVDRASQVTMGSVIFSGSANITNWFIATTAASILTNGVPMTYSGGPWAGIAWSCAQNAILGFQGTVFPAGITAPGSSGSGCQVSP